MRNLAELAFYELYPDKVSSRELRVKYSRSFRSYNANVKYTNMWMEFKLAHQWKEVGDEIKIGLIQTLMAKVFKDKKRTINMDLYENFIKGVGEYRPATTINPVLEESFERVNQKYFNGFMEKTNLVWGQESFRKLGMFTYADNTITMSTVLKDSPELLDYVMYHEMLHKKHKYTTKNNRSHHHTPEFKAEEAKFELPNAEAKLHDYLRRKKYASYYAPRKEKATKSGKESPEDRKKKLWEWFFG
jgi:predicted metal-dependent hydrolase